MDDDSSKGEKKGHLCDRNMDSFVKVSRKIIVARRFKKLG